MTTTHHRDTENTEANVWTFPPVAPPGGKGGSSKVILGVLGVSVVNR